MPSLPTLTKSLHSCPHLDALTNDLCRKKLDSRACEFHRHPWRIFTLSTSCLKREEHRVINGSLLSLLQCLFLLYYLRPALLNDFFRSIQAYAPLLQGLFILDFD